MRYGDRRRIHHMQIRSRTLNAQPRSGVCAGLIPRTFLFPLCSLSFVSPAVSLAYTFTITINVVSPTVPTIPQSPSPRETH
ncbi:hypothetical protein C8Q74DRAFT_1324001 [Fomes fomentarius]|nr:hypothetical protein C8Q74DRAFT_1324001 [Fomes fomentarius]